MCSTNKMDLQNLAILQKQKPDGLLEISFQGKVESIALFTNHYFKVY